MYRTCFRDNLYKVFLNDLVSSLRDLGECGRRFYIDSSELCGPEHGFLEEEGFVPLSIEETFEEVTSRDCVVVGFQAYSGRLFRETLDFVLKGIILFGTTGKLGGIPHFSFPAGTTCPGATEFCAKICYTRDTRHASSGARRRRLVNLLASLLVDFDKTLIYNLDRIKRKAPRINGKLVLRLFEEGDIYSAAFARKLASALSSAPNWRFLLYTRSWRVSEVRESLGELTKLENVVVYFSVDPETGPPESGGLQAGIEGLYVGDRWYRLSFSNKNWIGKLFYCPNEWVDPRITCKNCGFCYMRLGDVTWRLRGVDG